MTDMSVDTFISSIKIKGLHFLPPVITTKRRIELQRYKQQAFKLEKRLQICRDLRKNLQELLVYKPCSEYYHSSESDSVVEDSSISKKNENTLPVSKRRPVLSHDIIDVTEYSKDGIKIIDNKFNHENDSKYIDKPTCTKDNSSIQETDNLFQKYERKSPPTERCEDVLESIETNLSRLQSIIMPSSNSICANNLDETNSSPPRLIRSNSYILENPSPILLAHLDKLCQDEQKICNDLNEQGINEDTSNFLDKNYIPFENSQFSSLNTVCDTTSDKNEHQVSDINIQLMKQPQGDSSPKIEVIQTDISVQHITVDYHKNTCEELDIQKSSLELVDPNCQLIQVLKAIPEDYSTKILDLIEKQQIEQSKKNNVDNSFENCSHLTQSNCDSSKHVFENYDHLEESLSCKSISESIETEKNNDRLSLSPSQSIYYTLSSTGTVLPSSPIEIVDLVIEGPEISNMNPNNNHMINSPDRYQQLENCQRKLSFRQERCKQLNAEIVTIKQEWAASIIGAHVRGYLTRRLLRTERVQTLINTIKDALICALQLHNVDNIDESDVELHRRLINQVTAACYTFHDIFFSTSIAARMAIISTDRRRKLEKAKRPASAPAPRQNKSCTKIKPRTSLSQSLTKV